MAGGSESFDRYLTLMEAETRRISRIVANLLTFSRQSKMEAGVLDINGLIEKTLTINENLLKIHHVQVRTDLDPALPPVVGSADQLQQVFMNMVSNAAEAMENQGGGVLTVKTWFGGGDSVHIAFADTGVGISPEHSDKLFEPFYTTKKKGKGVGLGLSVVYGIIKAHNGNVTVDSEPGNGARFTIQLPLSPESKRDEAPDIGWSVKLNKHETRFYPGRESGGTMSKTRIMVVDDELIIRESLAGWLERDGHHVETADSGEAALKKLTNEQFDILLVDIKMEGMSGLDLLRVVNEQGLDTAVVMITAYGSISTAIEAMKSGAVEYLLKPFDPEEIGVLIEKIISRQAQEKENLYLREEVKARTRFESMIGQSAAMQQVFDLIRDVAPTDSTVLITGETGTGKGSGRQGDPHQQPPQPGALCGRQLRGHSRTPHGERTLRPPERRIHRCPRNQKGASGTGQRRAPFFSTRSARSACGCKSTCCGCWRTAFSTGWAGTQPLEADFRVIAATNRDLKEAIAEGSFREDLFYRLNVIAFAMPPLSHRKEDIPLLCDHFLRRFAQETNKPIRQVSREAMDEMMLYDWPGNIRELENAIERAVVVGKGAQVMVDDLPIVCGRGSDEPADHSLKAIEKNHIRQVLEENDWNISICAKILGIDRSTLYSKIKRYQLQSPS